MNTATSAIATSDILKQCSQIKFNKIEIEECVRRWGGSVSIPVLNEASKIFTCPLVEGMIGYRIEAGCAVVYGDPLCDPKNMPTLASAFDEFCREMGWRVIYVTASHSFTSWARGRVCRSLLEVGEELFLDPFSNPKSGTKGRALRNKVNNSFRAGIQVHEYLSFDKNLEREIEKVGASWLEARRGPQIYLAKVDLFSERLGKRWFYATRGHEIVGVLLLQQLEVKKGWLIQLLMAEPSAPIGTSEQLVMSVLSQLQKENCHLLSFGLALAGELGEIVGLNSVSVALARLGVRLAKKIFHLDRKRRFWRKFQPQSESHYVLFSESKITLKDARCIMKALNVSLK